MSVALPPCLVRVEARIALAPGRQLRLVERQFLGVDVEHAAVAAAFAAVERERLFRRAWRKVGKHGGHALCGWGQSVPRTDGPGRPGDVRDGPGGRHATRGALQ